MSKVLSKSDIQKADDHKVEPVEVPEWGGTVLVRTLNGTERDQYEQSIMATRKGRVVPNLANARAKLCVLACVDEAGEPLFTPTDVKWLATKSAQALERVFEAARRLAGLSSDDMEELLGNSESDPSDGSTSV